MPLEAVVVCMDCSEYMRNGDYSPTRFDSQKETCDMIWTSKLNNHPETAVGLLTMGLNGKAQVVKSCTEELGELQSAMAKCEIKGEANILVALHTAQLALKHRANKNAAQRIVLFVGSPINVPKKQLVQAGRKLKKNKVSVDVINFGEVKENDELLKDFYKAVKQSDSCNYVPVPRGQMLAQYVGRSNILSVPVEQQAPALVVNPQPGLDGIDANQDPELAMAIRMSLEEEKAREERQAATIAPANPPPATIPEGAEGAPNSDAPAAGEQVEEEDEEDGSSDEEDDDEEAMLKQAVLMSLGQDLQTELPGASTKQKDAPPPKEETKTAEDMDRDLMQELLGELPGMKEEEVGDLDELLDTVDSVDTDPDESADKKKSEDGNDKSTKDKDKC